MLKAVHDEAIVDFVAENHQVVTSGQFDDLLEHFARVQRACRVVRVDDDERLGSRRDFRLHVGKVREPVGLLVANIMNRCTARERGACGPQRIIGRWNKNLVAVVEERLHAELDELAHAVAGVNTVHIDVGNVLELGILHDCLACRKKAARIGIAFAFRQLVAHVLNNLIGGAETEWSWISDVEL